MSLTSPIPSAPVESADCRCICGSLVARLVDGAVELKCRRCKRTIRLPLADAASAGDPRRVSARR